MERRERESSGAKRERGEWEWGERERGWDKEEIAAYEKAEKLLQLLTPSEKQVEIVARNLREEVMGGKAKTGKSFQSA